jgi:hypothetical protein
MIKKKSVLSFLSLLTLLVPLVLSAAGPGTPRAQAQTNTLTLNVISARTEPLAGVTKGDPIANYKYIINVDNTGTTTQRLDPATGALPTACTPAAPNYPASCDWVSIAGAAGSSPIYTQGDQSDFAAGINLPDGRYLISVLADGYKLDGAHFAVAGGPVAVTVELQPTPLPAGTIQAAVFEDISPVNGAPDVPAEHGLAGFTGKIVDYLGLVTTDVFGNPMCTEYERDAAGNIILDANNEATPIPGTGGVCVSKCYVVNGGVDLGWVDPLDASGRCPDLSGVTASHPFPWVGTLADGLTVEGKLIIPNLGPNRYALSITPPDGTPWVQTTTLEGNHDWDAWVMEGDTGLDTEFVVAGEPFPGIIFGYVYPTPMPASPATGEIKGLIAAVKVYIPPKGGLALPGTIFGGTAGGKIYKPIDSPWVTLTDLTNGDTAIYVGQGNPDGTFDITGVPDGNYSLAWWDEPQDYILDLVNVTVSNGETVDFGVLPLNGWWTEISGYVFEDSNRNGVMDPGERGLPNFAITMRKRENSLMDRGATLVTTDASGYYYMENAYPMTQWLVEEAYNDLYYTTGVTYQADNQPEPTTVLGAGVDVSVLPIIGLSGRLDWGVHAYDASGTNGVDPQNGGIVGTVSYDTTRNELDPRYAVAEDWQPGIPDLNVNLYATLPCAGGPCDETGRYELASDGSYAKGPLLNTYVTETWERPTGCVARDVDGIPLVHGVDEQVLPTDPYTECLEGPLMSVQFQNGYSTVNGNYGFAGGCFGPGGATGPETCADGTEPTLLPGGRDYLVEVEVPPDALGRPMYKVTREEDINIANGDQFIPQVPPPACAGPLHTVDVLGIGTDGYGPVDLGNGIIVPASTPTDNATFVDIGASPYEGLARPLCNMKLVPLNNGKSVAPLFHYFTDVPIPGRFWGLIVDDLNFSSDPRSLLYGEKAGVPFAPVGIYDYTNRLVATVESDFNGLFDVLLPSSNRISCPTPSGVCANLYRFVGNDPGTPGQLNPNYNPNFRTIAAPFEAIPGLLVPADLAPTQVGVTVQLPGGQVNAASICALDPATPQLFAVARPYVNAAGAASERRLSITGLGFGATQGAGHVDLDGSPLTGVVSWIDTHIEVNVPANTTGGPHQLTITASNGQQTINGLTIHMIRSTGPQAGRYNPNLYEVGPGRTYAPANTLPLAADHAIQRALDAAAASPGNDLVVVYPGLPSPDPRLNPRGAYYENLIITSPVKLQGVGPGSPDGSVPGSIIDGGAFGGDSPVFTDWYAKIGGLTWDGNQNINDGAAISIYTHNGDFAATYKASIDGFDIRGGDQQGFPNNINQIGGGNTGLPANVVTQGGAIFANAYARYLQITNNVIENNGGAYGTVRIGTPDLPAPDTNQQNAGLRIANNRIIANAGTNLAGGIGLFAGADSYEVAHNDICGNFSAEYGGGMTVYGLSPNGSIHHNRVYFNRSYDEGGGIMISGQLPADPATLSPGSGAVNIYANLIQANLGNDDGGGIRFLMAGNFPMNVYNNMIVNNVSTHEGGGISLNDAPNVRVYNNTIMKNLTTATAATSNGTPAPAGLSSSANSILLQATLPAGSPSFSRPLLFNNIFWDNRAGTRVVGTVTGLGLAGPTDIAHWDLGVADGTGVLLPTNSIVQVGDGAGAPTNLNSDPMVVAPYDLSVAFNAWRTNPNFVGAILVAVNLPTRLTSDYHLQVGSPAIDRGAASKVVPAYQQPPTTLSAPARDIDDQVRPAGAAFDIGADEFGAVAAIGSQSNWHVYLPLVGKP